ncbi:hypothetical protein Spith_0860 [Spirochaeta thermophila DSM 6578]|uniref:Uncharacterized protein n=1 Tax=Winmispira thermophila (strain ATCC 700085 / DSM 6578 / Z-1203) TaxID=869211 RepID=G0GBQ7_WINT7|nr:hypothetical protein [Spirochaeta thermophila]AEJ61135.1 hypothetical protein Spith_0860 [Spirochaeta thermophila DSM 6578]
MGGYRFRFVLRLVAFLIPSLLPGQVVSLDAGSGEGNAFPSSWEARAACSDILLGGLYEFLAAEERILPQRGTPYRVKVLPARKEGAGYLVFIPSRDDRFVLEGPGTWVVKRSLKDGSFLQAKIFLGGDPGNAIRLYPEETWTRMDVSVMDIPWVQGLRLPYRFEDLLVMPEDRWLPSAGVPWEVFSHVPDEYDRRVEGMVDAVRPVLPLLPDADDGALDAAGVFVRIATGEAVNEAGFNCSGFAKWIGDSIAFVQTGRLLDIETLKRRYESLRGSRWGRIYEEVRDPYFGLDWTRSLAEVLHSLLTGSGSADPEAHDVREVPGFRYVEDVGFRVKDLAAVLYLEAVRRPGYFYFGSVNGEWGEDPTLWQHYHVAVFFPFFDEGGRFHIVVMERGRETPFDSFVRYYESQHVHLVRVPVPARFSPYIPSSLER